MQNKRGTLGILVAIGLLLSIASGTAQNSVKLLQGKVTDSKTSKPVTGGMVTMMMSTKRDTMLIRRARVNSRTGKYQIVVEPSDLYSFLVEAPGYYSAEIVAMPKEDGYEEIESNLTMKPAPVGDTTFSGSVSVNDKNQLIANKEFEDAAKAIAKNRGVAYKISMDIPVDVKSALDRTGPSLEQRYLTAMKAYMSSKGISTMRLTWEVVTVTDNEGSKAAKSVKEKKVAVSVIVNGSAEIPKEDEDVVSNSNFH